MASLSIEDKEEDRHDDLPSIDESETDDEGVRKSTKICRYEMVDTGPPGEKLRSVCQMDDPDCTGYGRYYGGNGRSIDPKPQWARCCEEIRDILREHPKLAGHPLRSSSGRQYYPLSYVVRKLGNLDIVREVYELYPLAVQAEDSQDGYLPLHWACYHGADENVLCFLAEKYPEAVFSKDKYGHLPLQIAANHYEPHPGGALYSAATLKMICPQEVPNASPRLLTYLFLRGYHSNQLDIVEKHLFPRIQALRGGEFYALQWGELYITDDILTGDGIHVTNTLAASKCWVQLFPHITSLKFDLQFWTRDAFLHFLEALTTNTSIINLSLHIPPDLFNQTHSKNSSLLAGALQRLVEQNATIQVLELGNFWNQNERDEVELIGDQYLKALIEGFQNPDTDTNVRELTLEDIGLQNHNLLGQLLLGASADDKKFPNTISVMDGQNLFENFNIRQEHGDQLVHLGGFQLTPCCQEVLGNLHTNCPPLEILILNNCWIPNEVENDGRWLANDDDGVFPYPTTALCSILRQCQSLRVLVIRDSGWGITNLANIKVESLESIQPIFEVVKEHKSLESFLVPNLVDTEAKRELLVKVLEHDNTCLEHVGEFNNEYLWMREETREYPGSIRKYIFGDDDDDAAADDDDDDGSVMDEDGNAYWDKLVYYLNLNRFGRSMVQDPDLDLDTFLGVLVAVLFCPSKYSAQTHYNDLDKFNIVYGHLHEAPGRWSTALANVADQKSRIAAKRKLDSI